MQEISTKKLVEELTSRLGVNCLVIPPHETYQISINGKQAEERSGPSILIIVED